MVRKFEYNYNDAIAHKAKAIVQKEELKLLLASQNYIILKEVRKFYGLDSKKKIQRPPSRTWKWIEYKKEPKLIWIFKKWKNKIPKLLK
ncbi:hypothetical protein [Mesomycoplasma ovipneumoniae]|uniref:hypothetical protein n=1 Tax=Mesomycoplasma ovipneumoniae TaxID=29562 RepID=UPI00311AE6D7